MKYFDRVKETSTSTGTGDFALSGASTGYRSFASVLSVNDTCYYCIAMGSEWEVGYGTYSATNTLTRTTVQASSNSGSAVNFSAGTKEVFLTVAARRFDIVDLSSASSDYLLLPGETAKVVYSSATSVQLHIASEKGLYEISIVQLVNWSPTNGNAIYFNPNNQTGNYSLGSVVQSYNTSISQLGGSSATRPLIGKGSAIHIDMCVSISDTSVGSMNARSICINTTDRIAFDGHWWLSTNDTGWGSLGTITYPFAQSGTITIKRIA